MQAKPRRGAAHHHRSLYELPTKEELGAFYATIDDPIHRLLFEVLENILQPLSPEDFRNELWKQYENEERELEQKISSRSFDECLKVLENFHGITPTKLPSGQIALVDGHIIDLKNHSRTTRLSSPVDYWLNFTKDDWHSPVATPLWDKNLRDHASEEDGRLLEISFGYILSGMPVKDQECLLLLHGPRDSGKSTLLEFLRTLLGKHAVNLSIASCLNNPVQAVNILGKRVALSSESNVKASDYAKFRRLISGEGVHIKMLYVSEAEPKHDCVFVAATNDDGWIENTPENRKRIRVVTWGNSIGKPDFRFAEKLQAEAPGVIAKCLRAFAPFLDT
jgi:hypothetical protein